MPGPSEWIIIGLVVVLVFGAKKLPEFARSLGRAQGEFKKGLKEGHADGKTTEDAEPTDGASSSS